MCRITIRSSTFPRPPTRLICPRFPSPPWAIPIRRTIWYDLTWFWQAAEAGNLPAVAFLKAPAYQNGHPGGFHPLDEQVFIVDMLNDLQRLPEWRQMAVIIAWDDFWTAGTTT